MAEENQGVEVVSVDASVFSSLEEQVSRIRDQGLDSGHAAGLEDALAQLKYARERAEQSAQG